MDFLEDIEKTFIYKCKKCYKLCYYLVSGNILPYELKNKLPCHYCDCTDLTFKDVKTSAFGTIYGKVDYVSCEKQSEINIKQQGRDKVVDLINEDPVLRNRVKPHIPWWRDGSVPGLERHEKVLNETQVKQVKEKLKTMEAKLG